MNFRKQIIKGLVFLFCSACFVGADLDTASVGQFDDLASETQDFYGPSYHLFQPLAGDYRYNLETTAFLWIPPVGYIESTGEVNQFSYQRQCGTQDLSHFTVYPSHCLSSIMVTSYQKFTATVNIYDNTGKWIHGHKQSFGDCGELRNSTRINDRGAAMSWLVWNQSEDTQGSRVGSGVYIWKVFFEYEDGTKRFGIFKQGIARDSFGQLGPQVCVAN